MQTRSMSIKSAQSKNPLYIPEITDHMFQFLNLSDIKICRSVCQKWNQLAEKFLKRLSIVNIINPKRAEDFSQVFPNAQQSQIFSCFRLGCQYVQYEWPAHKLVSFFEKWHHNLSEITLLRPDFCLEKENATYDVSPLLPSTLTKLHLDCLYDNNRMIISTDKICNIRILQLEWCILNIMPGTTLNCVEIELHHVTFREGKEDIEEFFINPWLNLDVLNKATFTGENMKLDLRGSLSLDMLSLQDGVKVVNWETSNWEIKELTLFTYPCVEGELWKSPVKYKELETWLTHLNVSLLPADIEKLHVMFDPDAENTPRISGKHNYPDLKHLHMTFGKGVDFSPFVEEFKHSPQLTTLTVSLQSGYFSGAGDASILKTSSLPPSVKTLRAKDVRIILDHSLELESLVVHYALNDAKHKGIVQVANDLHLKNLVCVLIHNESINGRATDTSDNERGDFIKSLIDLKLDNFVVGHFPQVDNSEFEKSYLFPLVDAQAKYYLFQRGENGKAMSDRDTHIYRNY